MASGDWADGHKCDAVFISIDESARNLAVDNLRKKRRSHRISVGDCLTCTLGICRQTGL